MIMLKKKMEIIKKATTLIYDVDLFEYLSHFDMHNKMKENINKFLFLLKDH